MHILMDNYCSNIFSENTVPSVKHLAVLKITDFRLLWIGGTVSGLGSWLLLVALPVYTFHLTGSPTAVGLTLALESLPALLVGPWSGVLVDRWDLTRAARLANLAAAASVALLLLTDRPGLVWLIYLAAVAENLAGTVLNPAGSALTRTIVGAGPRLTAASALNSLSGSVLRLLAPPLGALVLAMRGFAAVVVIDIASYVVAAILVTLVGRGVTAREQPARGGRRMRADLGAALAQVAQRPMLRGPLIGFALFLIANSGLTALLVPLVEGPLASPGYAVGYLITGLGVGYLAGSTLAVPLLARLHIRRVLAGTQLAIALAFFLLVDAPNLATAVIATAVMGVPGSILLIAVGAHVQRMAPSGMQGRVGALSGATAAFANIIGALCAPALVAATNLTVTLNAMSAFALLAAAATRLTVPPPTVPVHTARQPTAHPRKA